VFIHQISEEADIWRSHLGARREPGACERWSEVPVPRPRHPPARLAIVPRDAQHLEDLIHPLRKQRRSLAYGALTQVGDDWNDERLVAGDGRDQRIIHRERCAVGRLGRGA